MTVGTATWLNNNTGDNMTTIIEFLPYLILGLGIGYLASLGTSSRQTSLDRKRDELEAKKHWIRMQGSKK